MTDLTKVPDYVPGHGLLKGKRVVITAAAGTGIGFAAAKKCIEEGAQVFMSDIHEGRLKKAQDKLEQETGHNASVLGWRAQKGQAHYAAAKAGVMALTRCAGVEGAEFGVRVNAVAPSLALHPFLHKVTSKELLAELEAKEAYGRGSEVWEQANVMVFLASDYSSYMTGEVISTSSQRA